jgi:protein ImuB
LYACIHQPAASATTGLVELAQEFSPRFERHGDDLISIDVSGLGRLFGSPRAIGEELRRSAAIRGLRAHVAIASTRTAAIVLALAHPVLTVIDCGHEAEALAPIPIDILTKVPLHGGPAASAVSTFRAWGLKTLGAVAALPAADLAARLGQQGLVWQTIARGRDVRPLVPTPPEDRFEASMELEWPIEGLEPLSFVLTRLLEPLSTRLERRDRGAAVLHVALGLVKRPATISPSPSPDTHERTLQLPSPIRDVRTLRTLILLDLESHLPPAAIERVAIRIEPTPGRVLQHTLYAHAHPTPEQLTTLMARLFALMGQDRVGGAALVDSYRPGAFTMKPFGVEHDRNRPQPSSRQQSTRTSEAVPARGVPPDVRDPLSALRRCRHPVPARVTVASGTPVYVTTDRRGFAGGQVLACAGPWRISGMWWETVDRPPSSVGSRLPFNRDEWDVSLSDGAVYRIFQDRDTNGWFIDAIVD